MTFVKRTAREIRAILLLLERDRLHNRPMLRLERLVLSVLFLAFWATAWTTNAARAEGPPTDAWAGLRFLLGDWTGVGSGKPGEPTGGFSFAPDLDGNILVRKNFAEVPSKPGQKQPARHEDLMIVYPLGTSLAAMYFDNEGHVIRYAVTTAPGKATFESEETSRAPRFKLVYEDQKEKGVGFTFSIAPPGKPYQTYLRGELRRKDAQ